MRRRAARPMIGTIALAVLAPCVLAPPAAGAVHGGSARVWRESLATPAQFDLSLTEVRFSGSPIRRHSTASRLARSIRLAATGSTGLYYFAGAVTRFGDGKRPRVLTLVVN